MRMGPLVAALALPQLALLPGRVADWNASHDRIAARLAQVPGFALPTRPQPEAYAQSSLQFRLPGRSLAQMRAYVDACRAAGVWVKWFGADIPEGYSSNPAQWPGVEAIDAPRACAVQATLCDIRLPLGLSSGDCNAIADVLIAAAELEERRHAQA